MIIEGINNEECMSQIRRKSVNKSWSDKDEEDDENMACEDIQTNVNTSIDGKDYILQDPSKSTNKTWSDMNDEIDHRITCEDCTTTNKVQSETEHFCYDQFILEFSKLENNFKHFCNIDSKLSLKMNLQCPLKIAFKKK